jgi:hypothetical protein
MENYYTISATDKKQSTYFLCLKRFKLKIKISILFGRNHSHR